MKIKFGNIIIELPYEKFLKCFFRMENPFETMFPRCSQDFLNAFSKMTPSSLTDFFEEYRKFMEKSAKMSKSKKSHH